jgi:hypothetical protein
VLAVAQSTEGRLAKRRWDETLRGKTPNPGWTTRLGDMGRELGITAVATGKMLERLGYRSDKHVTDAAVAAGCAMRRWDGYVMHDDWHVDRAVAAIRTAAQDLDKPAVADALAAAVANQQGRERVAARKREQEEAETPRRHEEEALISGLRVELRALRGTDPGMSLLTAVEYITSDPPHRIALYRCCHAEDRSIGPSGVGQDGFLKTSSLVDKDLALLERAPRLRAFRYRGRDEELT